MREARDSITGQVEVAVDRTGKEVKWEVVYPCGDRVPVYAVWKTHNSRNSEVGGWSVNLDFCDSVAGNDASLLLEGWTGYKAEQRVAALVEAMHACGYDLVRNI